MQLLLNSALRPVIEQLGLCLTITEYQIQLIVHVVSQQYVNKLLFVVVFEKVELFNRQESFHARVLEGVEYAQLGA